MRLRIIRLALAAIPLSILVVACSDDEGPPPYGAYGLGNYCASNYDCGTGFCCTSPPCGHGTCSYRCGDDIDCPVGALCEGGVCFAACRGDADCYAPMRCKTARRVCQY